MFIRSTANYLKVVPLMGIKSRSVPTVNYRYPLPVTIFIIPNPSISLTSGYVRSIVIWLQLIHIFMFAYGH